MSKDTLGCIVMLMRECAVIVLDEMLPVIGEKWDSLVENSSR